MDTTTLGFAVVALALIGATVAVSLGHIDGQTYAAILSAALGLGGGAGAHAAGAKQAGGGGQ